MKQAGAPRQLVDEYIELSRRRFNDAPPLSAQEEDRWVELRDLLEEQVQCEAKKPPPERVTRRQAVRVPCLYSVRCSGEGTSLVTGALTEIAEGGVFIATEQPYARGARVSIEIVRDPQSAQLELDGIVVWSRSAPDLSGPAGMGIRFEDLSPAQFDVISDFVRQALLLTVSRFDRG